MSVGTAQPSSGAMSAASTFSYAQAAKGQSATQTTSQPSSSQATPASNDVNEGGATTAKSGDLVGTTTTPAAVNGNESVGQASATPTQNGQAAADAESKRLNEESSTAPEVSPEPPVPSTQDAEKPQSETASQSGEKQDGNSSTTSRAQDPNDAKKKKGKKSKGAEKDGEQDNDDDAKETSPPPPVELTEAPIPAVNIWQQRREAQAAKAKMSPSLPSSSRSSANGSTGVPAGNSDHKPRTAHSEFSHSNAVHSKPSFNANKLQKRGAEHARNNSEQAFRRSAPRGSRFNEKEGRPASDALPSVANPASWPTPETAAVETKTQSNADKSEKDEKEDSVSGKPRQKWVPIPFVPSVSFNTPLPTRGGPRGGGRAGTTRGGREGAPRGHQNAGVTNTNDRAQGNGSDSRATSVAPQASKRTPADASAARESRKSIASTDPKHAGNSSNSHAKAESLKQSRADAEINGTQQAATHHTSADRHSEATTKPGVAKDSTHSSQETGYPAQNGGSHRHSERTRGSGRGRGGHPSSASVPHQSQSLYNVTAPGYGYPANNGSRQAQPFSPTYAPVQYGAPFAAPNVSGHRGRPGSMSTGRSQSNGGRHGNGRPSMIQPVNLPYDPAIYSPQPAFNYFETSILTLVQTQIEYYFSIDNLCKDMFLRRHMDSQGFVFLKTITQFRRMQELTHDHNLVRVASESSREVELVTGEDGFDRIRRREGWEMWVQPMDQRDPSAQNNGPKAFHRNSHAQVPPMYHMMHGGYPVEAPAVFSPNGTNPHFAPYVNGDHMVPPVNGGLNGHAGFESHLSAAVPEFSPAGFGGNGNTGSERAASSKGQDPHSVKAPEGVASSGEAGVHPQPNGFVPESGEQWQKPRPDQVIANGVNGGHVAEQS